MLIKVQYNLRRSMLVLSTSNTNPRLIYMYNTENILTINGSKTSPDTSYKIIKENTVVCSLKIILDDNVTVCCNKLYTLKQTIEIPTKEHGSKYTFFFVIEKMQTNPFKTFY